jgi:hypothetical protein
MIHCPSYTWRGVADTATASGRAGTDSGEPRCGEAYDDVDGARFQDCMGRAHALSEHGKHEDQHHDKPPDQPDTP